MKTIQINTLKILQINKNDRLKNVQHNPQKGSKNTTEK